ncbi:hypothetical protein T459_23030 [Capsicum annuum]|uniref:Transposase-associated domain-containing protein n=1 Tax=Capsicum annuum TaxID=4072 RepID=A0A2G2YRE5_CAPAN|nr:hypothetical protein T459_23030 [Capsicum annuum]
MEKSWMSCKDKLSSYVYVKGVENFLQFAFKDKEPDDKIFCPYSEGKTKDNLNARLDLKEMGIKKICIQHKEMEDGTIWQHVILYHQMRSLSENTFHQYACNDYLYAFEEDEDFINWRRNDLEVISTDVTLADDIIEDIESEPEINDEDLLL